MNRTELTAYTKTLMNEVSPSNGLTIHISTFSDERPTDDLIDQLLDECAIQVLQSEPLHLVPHTSVDVSAISYNSSLHCGVWSKATDYLRLAFCSVNGWTKAVIQITPYQSVCLHHMGIDRERGTPQHPLVIDCGNELHLLPYPPATSAVDLRYVAIIKAEDLPLLLQYATCRLCATRVTVIQRQR